MQTRKSNTKSFLYFTAIVKAREIAFYKEKLEHLQTLINYNPNHKVNKYRYQITYSRYNSLLKTMTDLKELNADFDFF